MIAVLPPGQHPIEACYGSPLHCYWHQADGPLAGYRACGECGHMFATAAELLAAHNAVWRAAAPGLAPSGSPFETDPERVFCCPFCTHDF